jgi:uncharacterized glyoxalase superfamily protein PhnB
MSNAPSSTIATRSVSTWVFAEDVDATFNELKSAGANIVEPLEKKPWGLRQFTVDDLDGNRFYFYCD